MIETDNQDGLDILTVGEALVEIMRIHRGQPLDKPGEFIGPFPSGAPFIFAIQAVRLGMKSGAIGVVGDDAFGKCIHDQLKTDGMITAGLHTSQKHPTGVAFVAYHDDGSRNFVFSPGAGVMIQPEMLNPALFENLRCLHLMGSTLAMSETLLEAGHRALLMAKESGAKFSFDPNMRPELISIEEARTKFAPFIDAADVLLPTEEELCALAGASDIAHAIVYYQQQNPEMIIAATQGASGCTVYHGDQSIYVPGFTVLEVDPTGAGDCFDAGFLAGWLNGYSLAEAAKLANACGALAVTVKGPVAGAGKLKQVEDFIDNQEKLT